MEKKINYKELCAEYEGLLDMKDEIIADYNKDIVELKNQLRKSNDTIEDCIDDITEVRSLRKEVLNLKIDRIALIIITLITLTLLILK